MRSPGGVRRCSFPATRRTFDICMKKMFPRLLTMLVLGLCAVVPPVQGQVIDRVLVVVEDDIITEGEFVSAMRQAVGEIRASGQKPPPRRELEESVMERLILERLQLQRADALGIEISPAQVDRAIADIATRQGVDLGTVLETVRRAGMDEAQYRSDIRNQLRIQRVIDRDIRSRLVIGEKELDDRVAMLKANGADADVEYDVSVISLEVGDDAAQRAEQEAKAADLLRRIADGEPFESLARVYSSGATAADGGSLGWRGRDQLPEMFVAALAALEPGGVSDVIDTPGGLHILKLVDRRGGVRQVVEQWRVRHIQVSNESEGNTDAAEEQAWLLRERLLQGESFEELARVHSSDAQSRPRGGELGWVNPGETVPAFEEAIRNLGEGELSEPVQSPFGAHIIEVLERRRQDIGEQRLRQQAERQLREEKGREAYDLWLRRLREEAYVKFRVKPSSAR